MKANHLPAYAVALLLAACSAPQVIPTPAPAPTPASRPVPPAAPAPAAAPANWQDAPQTPGDWRWSNDGGRSTARFAGGLLSLICDRPAGSVRLVHNGTKTALPGTNVPLTIATTSITRSVAANSSTAGLVVDLASRDPLLDAMAFSRGRFAIQVPGSPTLYVPSWPEVSRVVEDCR